MILNRYIKSYMYMALRWKCYKGTKGTNRSRNDEEGVLGEYNQCPIDTYIKYYLIYDHIQCINNIYRIMC